MPFGGDGGGDGKVLAQFVCRLIVYYDCRLYRGQLPIILRLDEL